MNLQLSDQKILWRVLGAAVVLLLVCGSMAGVLWQFDRQAADYPQGELVSRHSNYKIPYYRWDDTYVTTDTVSQVYGWYSIRFDLGAESRANGACFLGENTEPWLLGERYTSVLICEMQMERRIYVNRSTSLR